MFQGALNTNLRSVLAELAPAWRGAPLYVGCSGNFTVERIALSLGISPVTGNDVSAYSSALGALMSGTEYEVKVRDPDLAWMSKYLTPGVGTVAHLLLCLKGLEFYYRRDHPYHGRMWGAMERRWPELHEKTVASVTEGLEGMTLAGYQARDVLDYFRDAPEEATLVIVPPAGKGVYDRLYKHWPAAFEYTCPPFEPLDSDRLGEVYDEMKRHSSWAVFVDDVDERLAGFEVARIWSGMAGRPKMVYSNKPLCRLTMPCQPTETVPFAPIRGSIVRPPITVERITQGQLNSMRSLYLPPTITSGQADVRFAVLADGELIGAVAFANSGYGGWCDVYMVTDIAVDSEVPRLSKLILAVAMSIPVQHACQTRWLQRVLSIGTSAFSEKAVSMKYRGLFDLHSRKEGVLNYVGESGRWTLEEAYEWWRAKFQPSPSEASS